MTVVIVVAAGPGIARASRQRVPVGSPVRAATRRFGSSQAPVSKRGADGYEQRRPVEFCIER